MGAPSPEGAGLMNIKSNPLYVLGVLKLSTKNNFLKFSRIRVYVCKNMLKNIDFEIDK